LQCLASHSRVIAGLPAQPPPITEAEVPAKAKVRVGRDGALASDDVSDSLRRHTDVFGKTVLREAQRLQKLFFKHLAGRDRGEGTHYRLPSVIVDNLDVGGSAVGPDEAQAPLSIDADAVLSLPIILQRFEAVSGWDLQIFKDNGPVKLGELAQCRALDVYPAPHPPTFEEGFGVFALEALDRHTPILTRCVNSVKRDARHRTWLCGLTCELSCPRRRSL